MRDEARRELERAAKAEDGRVLEAAGSLDGVAFRGSASDAESHLRMRDLEDSERAIEDIEALLDEERALRATEDHFLLTTHERGFST